MRILSRLILAAPMTVDTALKVLELADADLGDEAKLKAAYKTASYKHHPDRGGSTFVMQRVNEAYEVLKKISGPKKTQQYGPEFWADLDKKYHKAAAVVTEHLKRDFKPALFQQYFEMLFEKPFKPAKPKFSYDGADPERSCPSTISFDARFTSEDKETSLYLHGFTDLHAVVFPKPSLGGEMDFDKIGYDLAFMLDVLHNNHKHKLTRSNVKWTNLKSALSNPEVLFPLDKLLKKISSKKPRAFRRSDFESALRGKLDGRQSGTTAQPWAYIPFGDVTFSMYRVTISFGRGDSFASWYPNDLKRGKERVVLSSASMMESVELINLLADLQKKADTTDLKDLGTTITQAFQKANKEYLANFEKTK